MMGSHDLRWLGATVMRTFERCLATVPTRGADEKLTRLSERSLERDLACAIMHAKQGCLHEEIDIFESWRCRREEHCIF